MRTSNKTKYQQCSVDLQKISIRQLSLCTDLLGSKKNYSCFYTQPELLGKDKKHTTKIDCF
jgi:hypothetical protein